MNRFEAVKKTSSADGFDRKKEKIYSEKRKDIEGKMKRRTI
jgi:hypothetical protein